MLLFGSAKITALVIEYLQDFISKLDVLLDVLGGISYACFALSTKPAKDLYLGLGCHFAIFGLFAERWTLSLVLPLWCFFLVLLCFTW